jgi:hypothetical protein
MMKSRIQGLPSASKDSPIQAVKSLKVSPQEIKRSSTFKFE